METASAILDKYVTRVLPLTRCGEGDQDEARALRDANPASLFPNARNANAALSGLMLLLGCWEESHHIAQDIAAPEGSYWHAIAHRIEPDSSNAAYWFRHVGTHPIYSSLHSGASEILRRGNTGWRLKADWDPFLFLEWCDEARRHPGGPKERIAEEIQQLEWRLLFEWCTAAE